MKTNLRSRTSTRILLSLLLVLPGVTAAVSGAVPTAQAASAVAGFQDVADTFWGAAHIRWAVESGIVSGDGNGLFRPQDSVTEPEFLAMLAQAFPSEVAVTGTDMYPAWDTVYYQLAQSFSWPITNKKSKGAYNRGDVAQLITAAIGIKTKSTDEAVRYMLERGLAQGKTTNTVAGYGANDSLTRAEAVSFLHNLKSQRATLLDESQSDFMTLLGFCLGDTEAAVKARLGEPARKDPSTYGYTWYIYNKNLAEYAQFGISQGKVVAMYSNAPGVWKMKNGSAVSSTMAEAIKRTGQKADAEQNILGDTGRYVKTTYYFDSIGGNQVDAIMQVSNSAKMSVQNTRTSEALLAMEQQVLDITNAFRVKNNLKALTWDKTAAAVARAHSADMTKWDYFDHTDPNEQSPFDRMKAAGITFLMAGENIAHGYDDATTVFNGWLNSEGHREIMLKSGYTRLGVGIDGLNYTQDFFTPMP